MASSIANGCRALLRPSLSHRLEPSTAWTFARMMSNAPSQIFTVQDEDDYNAHVRDSKEPILVKFSATWCQPCQILNPRLEKAVSAEKGISLAHVDIDDLGDLAMEYDVRSVPTVVGLKEGKAIDRFIGVQDPDQIRTFIERVKQGSSN